VPRLKRLSAKEIIRILAKFGFKVISLRGSHVKLGRLDPQGRKQTLTIPHHLEIDVGTCCAIFPQASRYLDPDELRQHSFSD